MQCYFSRALARGIGAKCTGAPACAALRHITRLQSTTTSAGRAPRRVTPISLAGFELSPHSPADKSVTVQNNKKTGVTLVEWSAAPVNLFTCDALTRFNSLLEALATDEDTKCLVITSAIADVFTAGLDIKEMIDPQFERFDHYWAVGQKRWDLLTNYYKPIAIVITGQCPGAGCAIALTADYRIMVRGPNGTADPKKRFMIGLNEGKLGIAVPETLIETYSRTIGAHRADKMLQRGEMVTADGALAIGLVDEVVDTKDEGVLAALRYAEDITAMAAPSRHKNKMGIRKHYLLNTPEEAAQARRDYFDTIRSSEVQKVLKGYFAALGPKKKKKN